LKYYYHYDIIDLVFQIAAHQPGSRNARPAYGGHGVRSEHAGTTVGTGGALMERTLLLLMSLLMICPLTAAAGQMELIPVQDTYLNAVSPDASSIAAR
jgi:hypothetical protein